MKTVETIFSMEQKVESLVPASSITFMGRVDEMEGNAKCPNGSDKTLLISILKLNKLQFYYIFQLISCG